MCDLLIFETLNVVTSIIYGLMMLQYSKKIVTLRVNDKLSILYTIATSILIGHLSFQSIPYYYIYTLLYIVFLVSYFVGFEGKPIAFLFASGNFLFHLLCLKGIIVTFVSFVLETTMYDIIVNPFTRSLTTILLFSSASVFLVMFRKVYSEEKVNLLLANTVQVKMIASVQGVLNVTLVIATLIYSYDISGYWITFYHLLLSTMMIIGFYIVFKYAIGECLQIEFKENEEILKYQIQSQLEQYRKLSQHIKDLRRLKHDYNNQIRGLGFILESGDYEKAKEYVSEMDGEINANNLSYMQFSNNNLIDAIMQDAYSKAHEENIKFVAKIQVENIPLTDLEICTVFSNLLNNALEACKKAENDKQYIVIHSRVINHFWTIQIMNGFNGIVLAEKGKLVTTKKDKNQHGLGVETVEKIITSYDGEFEIRPHTEKKEFEVFILIPIT